MSSLSLKSLGLRHVALNVKDPQKSKAFYIQVLGMQVDWEPDPDNVYLTREGQDNLALHRAAEAPGNTNQTLDHFGFFAADYASLESWYRHVQTLGIKPEKELRTHRDGSSSFYFKDIDGILIQILHYPKIKGTSPR